MKNNKGFTIVELLVSFMLSMVLIIIMFQLIINLKDAYGISQIKTELLTKKNILENKIYTDLLEKQVTGISNCGLNCITFTFDTGESKNLLVDTNNNFIEYYDYRINLDRNSSFAEIDISEYGTSNLNKKNRLFYINVPIFNNIISGDNFGIRIVYPYNNTYLYNTYNISN